MRVRKKWRKVWLQRENRFDIDNTAPEGHTDRRAALTSPTVSDGLHSIVTANPSRLANRNRSVILLGSYLYGGRDFLLEDSKGAS